MATKSDIIILVELLDDWQKLHLRGHQRAMFFIWLSDHTKAEIHPDIFQEKLAEWLLRMNDVKAQYTEALTIQAEILYSSRKVEYAHSYIDSLTAITTSGEYAMSGIGGKK